MRYKELIDLGFKRNEIFADDKVFLDTHGYECFWLEKMLVDKRKEKVYLEWEPTEGKMELIHSSKDKDIVSRREITEDELKMLIDVFEREGDFEEKTCSHNMVA